MGKSDAKVRPRPRPHVAEPAVIVTIHLLRSLKRIEMKRNSNLRVCCDGRETCNGGDYTYRGGDHYAHDLCPLAVGSNLHTNVYRYRERLPWPVRLTHTINTRRAAITLSPSFKPGAAPPRDLRPHLASPSRSHASIEANFQTPA